MTGNSSNDDSPPPATPIPPGTARPDDANWDALARYFAGESSPVEAASVREWLAANPAEAARFQTLEEGIQRVRSALHDGIDVEASLRRLTARLETPESAPRVVPEARDRAPRRPAPLPVRRASSWGRRATLLAAAGVAAVALGTLVWRGRSGTAPPPTAAAQELTTTVGQRDSLRLADGSRVLLGPLSRLRVLPGYGARGRAVELHGNGLFDVRHDDAQPFVVRAGDVAVRDVGTTFTVEATDSTDVRVVVTSGSVQLANGVDARGVLIQSGDVGRARAGQRPAAAKRTANDDDLAWTRGQLTFRNAPLTTVANELRRWYGIELVLADSSFRRRTLTTTFIHESPAQAMRIIGLTLGARIEMHGDTAIVHSLTGAPRR